MDSSLLETAEAMDGEIPEAMALTLGNVHEELMTLSEFLKSKLAEVSERETACSLREEAVRVQEEAVASSLRALQLNSENLCNREISFQEDAQLLEQRLNAQLVDQVSLERDTFTSEKRRLQAKLEHVQAQLQQRLMQVRSLTKDAGVFKTHVRKLRKEVKGLRTEVRERDERIERMEFEMENMRTKLRLHALRRIREQEQQEEREREREEREEREKENRRSVLHGSNADSSMESQSQSQLSFAGTAERSVAARTSAAVERGYVHALDGIAQILLEYKVSGQGLKAKAKRAAASNEQKREVVEDIINVFPGISSALGSSVCRGDHGKQFRLLSLASHILHRAYESERTGGSGLGQEKLELAKHLMHRLLGALLSKHVYQKNTSHRHRKPPISPIGLQKRGFFEDESFLGSSTTLGKSQLRSERLIDSDDPRVRTLAALLVLQVHACFPLDPGRLVLALQALQQCCPSTLVDHYGYSYLIEIIQSLEAPSWRVCVKMAVAALLGLSQDGPHYAKFQSGVVSKAAFAEPCLHVLAVFTKAMSSLGKASELTETVVDAASFFVMILQRTTKTDPGVKLVRRLFTGKDLVSKMADALRVINTSKVHIPAASQEDLRFFALNADAVVQALSV